MKKEPGKFLKALPNIITSIRFAGAIALIHLSPIDQQIAFYVIYGCCGLTDFLDGTIARATHTCSKLGSRLDSIADIAFLGVMAYKFIPICVHLLSTANWILIGTAGLLQLSAYVVCLIRFKRMSAPHTYANKTMSALIFLFPFTLIGNYAPVYTIYAYVGSGIAIYAGLETLLIHCIAKHYDPKNQMIWWIKKNEKTYAERYPDKPVAEEEK